MNTNSALILASRSPRRKYLLEKAGLCFEVIPSGIDESKIPLSAPENYVRQLAEAKARDISQRYSHRWVIAADTIVVINNMILGKPDSEDDARAMLNRLSGRTHQVLTGYALFCRDENCFHSNVITTQVRFKKLNASEIEWYIQTGEPFDKAGAYAIQGIGTFLVKSINGSYTNVVGLPVCEVVEFLIEKKVVVIRKCYAK